MYSSFMSVRTYTVPPVSSAWLTHTHRQGTNDDIVIHDTTISGITSRVPQAKVVSVIGAEHDLLVVSPYKEKVLQELIAFLK